MTDRYFVIGNPIKHSLSPQIHAAFARQTGISLTYEKRLFEIGAFARDLEVLLQDADVCGANVTVPFKIDAKEAATQLTQRAARAGAVNTLKFSDNTILGDNTDGAGFVVDCEARHGIEFSQSKILVLGAGGASRGVLAGIIGKNVSDVAIANRTVSKAELLASDFSDRLPVRAISYEATSEASWDIVVNATSASISGALLPVSPKAYARAKLCYDLFYSHEMTAFMREASRCGACAVADGLGMLVEQAAESFYLWRGVRPKTEDVYQALRAR